AALASLAALTLTSLAALTALTLATLATLTALTRTTLTTLATLAALTALAALAALASLAALTLTSLAALTALTLATLATLTALTRTTLATLAAAQGSKRSLIRGRRRHSDAGGQYQKQRKDNGNQCVAAPPQKTFHPYPSFFSFQAQKIPGCTPMYSIKNLNNIFPLESVIFCFHKWICIKDCRSFLWHEKSLPPQSLCGRRLCKFSKSVGECFAPANNMP
ncbi:MAG: hypothetical protein AAGU77_11945, partial [Bacillota bacterium]